jgi:hypothetical protein
MNDHKSTCQIVPQPERTLARWQQRLVRRYNAREVVRRARERHRLGGNRLSLETDDGFILDQNWNSHPLWLDKTT